MDKIVKYYSSFDEWGRLDREPIEFLVNLHFIKRYLPDHGVILDNGAGPGKYSIELAKSDYQVTLTDLTPKLVEFAKDKIAEEGVNHQIECRVADARDLSIFADQGFDASLMLGPMYHLQTEVDRDKAISELFRVTRKDGYVFVAFMSRIKHLTTSISFPNAWKPNHTADGILEFLDTGVFNHSDEGRFTGAYYFNIEDIEPTMEKHGFQTVKLIASGSIAGGMKPEQWDYWREQGEEEYQKIINIIMESAENPYILGASSHLLYIGKRK
ncbi:class I SAM-dependent methyltransferase [Paenibacillus crassostreae]|uniref:Methyltransferase n=1 Tax=Paenibacillus crassostreae TaxID=1763538 RepID=A0A167FC16_9BACL|nr:class I SAM-dependent methyltransferase [Paenibacillus crassostreae]AOZ90838.1 methyltransferase [Paenibacillus crassostreae]OAB76396.1 methyltransferase [Paenibacillus crassostreae]